MDAFCGEESVDYAVIGECEGEHGGDAAGINLKD